MVTNNCILPTECVWKFRMSFRISTDYFHKQQKTIYVWNGEALCFLWGKKWIFKYRLYQLRLQGLTTLPLAPVVQYSVVWRANNRFNWCVNAEFLSSSVHRCAVGFVCLIHKLQVFDNKSGVWGWAKVVFWLIQFKRVSRKMWIDLVTGVTSK
jgi:hypothetical protein